MLAKQKLIDLLNNNLAHLTNFCKEIHEESIVFLYQYVETFGFKKTKLNNKKAIYYSVANSLCNKISKALILYQNTDSIHKVLNENDVFDCKLINKNFQILINGLSICLFLKDKIKRFEQDLLIKELLGNIQLLETKINQLKKAKGEVKL